MKIKSNNRKPNMSEKYHQGTFTPINTSKYLGDISKIFFRSKWEFNFCKYCDLEARIAKWGCEYIQIPYYVPNEMNELKLHKYYPDFYVEIKNTDSNNYKQVIIEIKPNKEVFPDFIDKNTGSILPPKNDKLNILKNYEYALNLYKKNRLKWRQAEEYCKKRNMSFFLLTEEYFKDKGIKLF